MRTWNMMLKKISMFAVVSIFFIGGGVEIQAQDSGIAAPEDMPAEIAEMLNEMKSDGVDVDVVTSDEPHDAEVASVGATAGTRYLYTTLRVVSKSANRGCGYANWNCMTNLCKKDLGTTAWRGWAGCWKKDSWICYFECGQRRDAF